MYGPSYIYLHLVDLYGKCEKYTSPMDPLGDALKNWVSSFQPSFISTSTVDGSEIPNNHLGWC